MIDERLARGYQTSRAGIYAAPRTLRPGQSISRERLIETLRRAGYVENEASNAWNGAFAVASEGLEIRPRRSAGGPEVVRVSFNRQGRISEVRGDGAEIPFFTLEPEVLTNDATMRTGRRAMLSYQDIPPTLARAILSIEDRRFFEHSGVDFQGLLRAVWRNVGDGEAGQGGSTITQQLVKNTYLTPERTIRRKVMEAFLSGALERRLSKEDIFALYCNEIYLGQRGSLGVRGVAQAAHVYFGKELSDLTLAEAATIAGMIQSPARYAPDRHPEEATRRRNIVLGAMLRDGAITQEEAATAASAPVTVAPRNASADAVAPHFVDYVNRLIEARQVAASDDESESSFRAQTTIDLDLQRIAEAAVSRQLEQLDRAQRGGARTPQAALVALDPRTGHVLAMVGGRDYAASQLNRATDARRQPGSVYKPFVMAAALENGISPVSLYRDEPRAFLYDRRAVYRPANYGNSYSMRDVTMREALVRSLNVVTVDLAMRTGLSRVASLAEGFGLARPEPYPSLALGTTEATPLEIAAAYAIIANGGRAVTPTALARAEDDANLISPAPAEARQVVSPATAYTLTDMLSGVIERGTARAARGVVNGVALAGKTGTSRDGWFVGYSPHLVCVVWVGFDDNSQLGLTGAESALPVWTEFMRGAISLRPELGGAAFERPAGISTVEIDPETGMLATSSCPRRERIAIPSRLAPGVQCYLHDHRFPTLAGTDNQAAYDSALMVSSNADHHSANSDNAPTSTRRQTHMPTLPRANAEANLRAIASANATTIERRESGRQVLTNELRVGSSGRGWQR